jgi:hypothetical protein
MSAPANRRLVGRWRIEADIWDRDDLLISGSKVRVVVRPPSKSPSRRRTVAMRRAEPRRAGVAILNAGGGDLTCDRQAHGVDGDLSLAALDFLAGVDAGAAGPQGSRHDPPSGI